MDAEEQFQNALDTVVAEALDDGLGYDTVISAFELKLMALKEEESEAR